MSESRKIVINETFFSSTGGGNKTKKNNNKPKAKAAPREIPIKQIEP